MSQPYVGEIILVGFNFAPAGWAFCDGQLMAISQNETLFNLIGTTYGGDGVNTFALPDLRGRTPIAQGSGTGTSYVIGQTLGSEGVSLLATTIPAHTHTLDVSAFTATFQAKNGLANQFTPAGNLPAVEASLRTYTIAGADSNMNAGMIALGGNTAAAGGSQAHNNLQPYLTLNYCIALFGVFPTQT